MDQKQERIFNKLVEIFSESYSKFRKTGKMPNLEVKYKNFFSKELKLKPQKMYAMWGKIAEEAGEYGDAARYYEKVGTPVYNIKSARMHEKSKTSKSIDSIVTVIMTLSGIGILYNLFSKEAVTASTGSQLLAPTFPTYGIYVFPLVFIVGGIYFLWKKAHKDLIPLSFQ